jgi:hypothetical protein
VSVCVCVCVCVYERECDCAQESVGERMVYESVWDRVWVRERTRESVCACACVRARVCVRACVKSIGTLGQLQVTKSSNKKQLAVLKTVVTCYMECYEDFHGRKCPSCT